MNAPEPYRKVEIVEQCRSCQVNAIAARRKAAIRRALLTTAMFGLPWGLSGIPMLFLDSWRMRNTGIFIIVVTALVTLVVAAARADIAQGRIVQAEQERLKEEEASR